MVKAMRTPSSSSSKPFGEICKARMCSPARTDVDRLDPDTLLQVCGLGAVAHFVREDLGLAKGVHERGTASARGTWGE